jgi:LPXTG-motif cell wall-anchored protein
MTKERPRLDNAVLKSLREGALASRCVRLGLSTALGASLVLFQSDRPRAQQPRGAEPSVSVTGVSTSGNVVSISADGSLNRAQTWQDPEGFHVVLVNGKMAGPAPGVKTRRVGNSLELIVPVRQGAGVTVNPRGNRLDLNVTGGAGDALRVENFQTESGGEEQQPKKARGARAEASPQGGSPVAAAPRRQDSPGSPRPERQNERGQGSHDALSAAGAAPNNAPQAAVQQPLVAGAVMPPAPEPVQQPATPVAQEAAALATAPPQASLTGEASVGESLVSSTSLFGLLGASFVGGLLYVLRRRRKEQEAEEEAARIDPDTIDGVRVIFKRQEPEAADVAAVPPPFEIWKGDRRRASIAVPFERRRMGQGAEDEASRQLKAFNPDGTARDESQDSKKGAPAPALLYGAYRIDQEIERLVGGQPHSAEVLASRAADDRRAIETSLLKALRAPESDEDARRRARMALEDYGFVARSCASLLLGGESFARATAARTLGEMRSAQSLPFLTEALYDPDPVVRTEAVESLGQLGLPSAIGALLDLARRHPDIPSSVLGPALTACSLEPVELLWVPPAGEARDAFEAFSAEDFTGEIRSLEPVADYEPLPDSFDEEVFLSALENIDQEDAEVRVGAARQLAHFAARRGVAALSLHALDDRDASVRAAAVTSLGAINHESVFVPVLVAMADESREVRAAAARALSRLSFDRADAYVRVLETADRRALGQVAHACVKAGLVTQAVGRLASEDRRQAYEAFSLLSLVVKAGEVEPVLETVERHSEIEVRLACVRLLGLTCPSQFSERLMHIAEGRGVPEKVRQAIVETVELASHQR